MDIQIQITAAGGVQMLHSDAVDLSALGEIKVCRASHVEYSDGAFPERVAGRRRGWYVQSAKTLITLADGFETRAEALAWEKQHYSPTGDGWTELTEGT